VAGRGKREVDDMREERVMDEGKWGESDG